MTYVEALEIAINAVDSETAEKLVALKTQIAKKKGSSKPTKTQVENEGIKTAILDFLGTVEKAKVGEITKALGDKVTSAQQVSALVTQLKNDGKVTRFTEKKDIFFAIVTE